MTYTTDRNVQQAIEHFQRFDADTKLALLWYGYLDVKDQLQPNPPQSAETLAQSFYDRVQAMPQEQQLQIQREIVDGRSTEFARSYSSLSPSGRMEFWYMLAQGIENGSIIGVPSDYKLPSQTDEFTNTVKQFDFEQRVSFLRSAATAMGTQAAQSAQ